SILGDPRLHQPSLIRSSTPFQNLQRPPPPPRRLRANHHHRHRNTLPSFHGVPYVEDAPAAGAGRRAMSVSLPIEYETVVTIGRQLRDIGDQFFSSFQVGVQLILRLQTHNTPWHPFITPLD